MKRLRHWLVCTFRGHGTTGLSLPGGSTVLIYCDRCGEQLEVRRL